MTGWKNNLIFIRLTSFKLFARGRLTHLLMRTVSVHENKNFVKKVRICLQQCNTPKLISLRCSTIFFYQNSVLFVLVVLLSAHNTQDFPNPTLLLDPVLYIETEKRVNATRYMNII